jgi:hypothetical protein
VGHRAGLDVRKISSPPGFDPGPSSPDSVAIPTELPGPQSYYYYYYYYYYNINRVIENDVITSAIREV